MKKFAIICVATVISVSLAGLASAGEVSKSSLHTMGLGKMQQLSSNDGLAIRGKGTSAAVWGGSSASVFGSHSSNGYAAAADHSHGSSTAVGANLSVAGSISNHGFLINGAGGGSFAFAK